MSDTDGTLRKRPSGHKALPNALLEDASLSYKARGMLSSLLCKPDGWKVRAEAMERAGTEGREAIRSGMRELTAHGYLRRRRMHHPDGTWWTEVEVSDAPVPEWITEAAQVAKAAKRRPAKTAARPSDGNPSVGNPAVGCPPVGNPAAVVESTQSNHSETADEESFAAFWKAYPRREGQVAAAAAYGVALTEATPERLLAAARRYASLRSGQDPKFTMGPTRWLTEKRWTDEPPSSSVSTPPPIDGLGLRAAGARPAPADLREQVARAREEATARRAT